jgi:2'-hydroxyisoflavone reductase
VNLLVLGGSVFLGRHLVDAALARGHEVTTFNRGRHNPELQPGVEKLRGDREGDLSALRGRRWDAVVDTSGNTPDAVRASAELLSVEHYTFVSTVAVYAEFPYVPDLDESAPLVGPDAEGIGALKARCEAELPEQALVVRAGLLAGPYDPTGRFTYWPRRIAQGGEVLAPGTPELRVQLIDARDLASWILAGVESRLTGAYNATGPAAPLTLGELLETCRTVTGGDARFTWVEDRVLLASCERPLQELPLWAPAACRGMSAIDCRRAIAAGLTFRPLAETVRDTLAAHPAGPLRAGLTREREAELLAALVGA